MHFHCLSLYKEIYLYNLILQETNELLFIGFRYFKNIVWFIKGSDKIDCISVSVFVTFLCKYIKILVECGNFFKLRMLPFFYVPNI